jgi:hypothetical protein
MSTPNLRILLDQGPQCAMLQYAGRCKIRRRLIAARRKEKFICEGERHERQIASITYCQLRSRRWFH